MFVHAQIFIDIIHLQPENYVSRPHSPTRDKMLPVVINVFCLLSWVLGAWIVMDEGYLYGEVSTKLCRSIVSVPPTFQGEKFCKRGCVCASGYACVCVSVVTLSNA